MGSRKNGHAQPAGSPAPVRPTFTQLANYLFVAAASGLGVFYTTHQAFQQANQDAREAHRLAERLASEVNTIRETELQILKETNERQDREIRELRRYLFSVLHNFPPNDERTSSWPLSTRMPIPASRQGPGS